MLELRVLVCEEQDELVLLSLVCGKEQAINLFYINVNYNIYINKINNIPQLACELVLGVVLLLPFLSIK